jgi:SAM-dependent methyltransferase
VIVAISHYLPWRISLAAKVALSRVPLSYRFWKRIGFFNQGAMERPEYAYTVFLRHFNASRFSNRPPGFVCLELGPGDSVSSALIAFALGASRTYLVDEGQFATADLASYQRLVVYLNEEELPTPDMCDIRTRDQVLDVCSAKYFTEGIRSLREIPSASVDFVFSHATLQQVRRADLVAILEELRRIQKPDGVGSHNVSVRDYFGGGANELRFSSRTWESQLIAKAGLYTNRVRYAEMLQLFKRAGFEPEVINTRCWTKLPISRTKLAPEFADLNADDLLVHEWDVLLH